MGGLLAGAGWKRDQRRARRLLKAIQQNGQGDTANYG